MAVVAEKHVTHSTSPANTKIKHRQVQNGEKGLA